MGEEWRILIAEDNEAVRNLLGINFAKMNWQVDSVPDGEQALALLRSSPYDVVLTDVSMPKMNGKELVAAMRQEEIDIPLVAMSAHTDLDMHVDLPLDPKTGLFLFKGSLSEIPSRVERFALSRPRYRKPSPDPQSGVLVVDDEEDIRHFVTDSLKDHYSIHSAKNSLEAHELLCRNDIGVAIVDKVITRNDATKENGIELAKRINSNYPYCRVLMMSGFMTTEDLTSVRSAISGFLQKPVTTGDLEEAVNKAQKERAAMCAKALADGTPHIWAVCGPRGVGKSTVVETLVRSYPFCGEVFRYSTRQPRPGEGDGLDHKFVHDDFFLKNVERPHDPRENTDDRQTEKTEDDQTEKKQQPPSLIEYHFMHNDYRVGMPRGLIQRYLSEGKDAIIVFSNPDSYEAMKKLYPEMKTIVLLAEPAFLVDRAARRGGDPLTLEEAQKQYAAYEPLARISQDVVTVRNHQLPLPKEVGPERYREYEVERCGSQAQYLAHIIEAARRFV